MWDESRQDKRHPKGRIEPGGEHRQAYKSACEGGDETDEHGVLGVGEHDGAVECRDGAGHDFGGDALECRHEFAKNGAYTEEDHGNGHTELESLGDGLHDVVAYAGGPVFKGTVGFGASSPQEHNDGQNDVHERHG